MRTLVIGAGAVGCYYAAMLARAGQPVTLLGRLRQAEVIARDGLLLETDRGCERLAVPVTMSLAAAADADLLLVCVKSGDTESLGRELAPYLSADACVLSLQNGIDNAERLSAVIGRPVIPVVVYVAVAMVATGHVRHHGRGDLLIGASPHSAAIAALLNAAGVPTTVSDDVRVAQWRKLIVNCAVNALSAIAQRSYGDLARQQGVLDLMAAAAAECIAVARAAGVPIDDDPRIAIDAIIATMPGQRSSTAQDLAAGRATEIDHLNGFVVRTGERLQVPTPVNRCLLTLVQLLERGRPR